MNKKTKKIIAREGIIFLGVILLVAFIALSKPKEERSKYKSISTHIVTESAWAKHAETFNGGIVVVDLWLLYLAVRFGTWAIRIIRDKE